MRYRVRHVLLCLAPALFVYTFIVVWAVWLFEAALQNDAGAFLVRSLVGIAVVVTAASALVTFWPTKRRPARLYHVTTSTVVDAATIEVHPDGTRTVELLGRRPGRPVYFFDRHPRRTSVEFNVWTRPDACIELIDVDYDGIVVRRRWTGAYHLRRLPHVRARIHPLPWDLDQRAPRLRRPRPSVMR
jgi:hypothetical protein